MKSLVQTVILILIILIGVPLALGLLFGGDKGETLKAEEMKNKMDTPNIHKSVDGRRGGGKRGRF